MVRWIATADLRAGPTLIVAPHGDDELLGCGGWLLRACRAGARVHVVFVYRREADRRTDSAAALADLPVTIEDLDVAPTGPTEIEAWLPTLATVARRVGPAWLLAPSRHDPHPHHVFARSLACAAACEAKAPVLEFEGLAPHPDPDVWLDITTELDEKVRRLARYRAEDRRLRLSAAARSLGTYRGCVSLRRRVVGAETYRAAAPLERP